MLHHRRSPAPLLILLASCPADDAAPGGVSADASTDASTSTSSSSGASDPDPSASPTTGLTTAPEPDTTTTSSASTTFALPDDDTGATTGAPLRCGDGIVDADEQCDAGHGKNSDSTSPCTLQCKYAVCGDGLVWLGHEACDTGDNYGNYGGCNPDCSLAPHCGDGELDGPEQCDLGPNNGTGDHLIDGVPCSVSCYHEALLVFLGSAPFPANFKGVAGADAACQQLAKTSGLYSGAPFMAWISDGTSAAASRFSPAIPGLPYALRNGQRVAKDRAALLATGPEIGITMTETGATIYEAAVWTNTNPDGTTSNDAHDCAEWNTTSPEWKGSVGFSGVDKSDLAAWQTWKDGQHWTIYDTTGCSYSYRLYCFEQ